MTRPICPKCGKRMMRGQRAQSGKLRWECKSRASGHCYSTTNPDKTVASDRGGKRSSKPPVFKRALGKVERFIVTSAQNATPVHDGFMKSLRHACNKLNAELLVIPLRYKNPTSRWTASQANEEYWHEEVQPYLWNTRKALNQNILVMGDIKTQPTASSPLTGFDAITHGESGIFGHTKLQLRCVPTPQGRLPKILTTTGACTLANYTDTRAGKLGEFHHTLGAALVETRGKKFHLRQINADKKTGAFIDLDHWFTPEGVKTAPPALALICGDTHVDVTDPDVDEATFGKAGMADTLRAQRIVYNDLLDGLSVNPHHRGNPFIAVAKRVTGQGDVKAEVMRALEFVDKRSANRESVIVPSNHDDMLQRWLVSHDWRMDPGNAEFYLQCALEMVRAVQAGAEPERLSIFEALARKHFASRSDVRCLTIDESYTVAGIELGMHGDQGPNGARGSIKNLRRIGIKSVIGHSHSPGIDEGCYQTGTSTGLRLGYNSGPSSWLNTHAVVYANGKRALLNVIDGDWRL